jgi:hypothetical protein
MLDSGVGITYKHWTRLEKLSKDKRFSFLRKILNYGVKSFITLAPNDGGVDEDGPRLEVDTHRGGHVLLEVALKYEFRGLHSQHFIFFATYDSTLTEGKGSVQLTSTSGYLV